MTRQTEELSKAVNNLADKIIGASFALWDKREALKKVVRDVGGVAWSIVAFENMLFFQHLIDRYAFELYGAEMRDKIMDCLYQPLVSKFAATGAIRADKVDELPDIFLNGLNDRNAEYANYQLEKVFVDEFKLEKDEAILSDEDREKNFASIMLTATTIREASTENLAIFEQSLLWHLADKIAELLGEPNSVEVTVYVYNYAIGALLMIHPQRELVRIKKLL